MKKILMLSVLAAMAYAGCKRKEDVVSRPISVSYPTIKITNGQFYSFPVGGGPMPNANTIMATAYDSFYHESIKPVVDASHLSNLKPGLYVATVSAKNSYGFVGYTYVYVAITDVNDTVNLAGQYVRASNDDTVNVTRMARGLYRTDNVGGVKYSADNAKFIVPGYFVQDGDLITLHMNDQPSAIGNFSGTAGAISMSPGDTTYEYQIVGNSNFGPSLRTFKKL